MKHRKGMKEVYYKVEGKMREYVTMFATEVQALLVSEWRFLFAELENLKETEVLLRKDNQILQAKCIE